MPTARGAFANVALLLASLALTGAALEAAARRFYGRGEGTLFVAESVEPDPVRGWRHRAGAAGAYGRATWAINSRGLRDVERPLEAPPGTPRVLVLGDSFAEGFSVAFESSVAPALERELGAAGCAAEVVNGGTVGYSTDQEYLFYRDLGAAYGARAVVLLFYYNDVLYNARGAVPGGVAKPLFTFTGGRARVKNYPLPPPPPASTSTARWRGSAFLAWFRERMRRGAPDAYDALARVRFWSPLDREPALEMRIFERDPPEPIVQAWLQTGHLLRLLDEETRKNGARLTVAYVPAKMEIVDAEWERLRAFHRIDDEAWDRGRLARLLAEAGRRGGYPVVDLTAALRRAEGASSGGVYLAGGGHWNEAGHAVAARTLAGRILESGVLECGGSRKPAPP